MALKSFSTIVVLCLISALTVACRKGTLNAKEQPLTFPKALGIDESKLAPAPTESIDAAKALLKAMARAATIQRQILRGEEDQAEAERLNEQFANLDPEFQSIIEFTNSRCKVSPLNHEARTSEEAAVGTTTNSSRGISIVGGSTCPTQATRTQRLTYTILANSQTARDVAIKGRYRSSIMFSDSTHQSTIGINQFNFDVRIKGRQQNKNGAKTIFIQAVGAGQVHLNSMQDPTVNIETLSESLDTDTKDHSVYKMRLENRGTTIIVTGEITSDQNGKSHRIFIGNHELSAAEFADIGDGLALGLDGF